MRTIGKFILMTISLTASLAFHAQSPLWLVGSNYLNDNFDNFPLPTPPNGYQGQPAVFTSNAYHNPVTGELLFFVVDEIVYDKDGYIINWMQLPSGDFCKGESEIAIVPDPASCSRFYIMTTTSLATPIGIISTPVYAILDFELDHVVIPGRKGALVVNQSGATGTAFYTGQDIYSCSTLAQPKIAVSPKRNDGSHLIYISDSYGIYTHILDENGITYTGWPTGFISFDFNDIYCGAPPALIDPLLRQRGEMELAVLSNGNMRIAVPFISRNILSENPITIGQNLALLIAELDPDGVFIPGTKFILPLFHDPASAERPYIHGLEFSPNGDYLYISHVPTQYYPFPLQYIDLQNNIGLQNLPLNLAEASEFSRSHLEIAQNGFLLMSGENQIAAIPNPNEPTANNNWNFNYLSISNTPSNPLNVMPWQPIYNAYASYNLPDQIDFNSNCQVGCYNFSCSDNSVDEACCNLFSSFLLNSFHDIVVSSNTTLEPGSTFNGATIPTNGIIKVGGNIIIEPGVTLNINNMNIAFSPTSRIIVSRGATTSSAGAQLNVNNSTLTVWENCGDCYMWQGVQVVGYTQISSNLPQGKVQFNNTVVEYAYMGVMNSLYDGTMSGNQDDFSLTPDYNTTGGRITAVQSTFRNNMQDATFWPYNHQHQSLFDRCLFITNNDLKSDLVSYPIHISATNNRNIFIVGGRFENETDLAANPEDRGLGILSVNSQVVINLFGTTQATRFNNLESGIYAVSTNSPYSLIVNAAEFNNNINGIYARGENRSIILNSEFRVFRALNGQPTHGIVFDGCNAYRVEDNEFLSENPLSSNSHNNFGVLVANSGPYANVIEKNKFINLRVGTAATGVNAENYTLIDLVNPPKGLQWLCNDFHNNVDDIVVRNGTIAPHQGNCFSLVLPPYININIMSPTGNTFSTNSAGTYHISMSNGVPPIRYFYNANDDYNEPLTYTSNVTPIPCFPSPEDFVCGRTTRIDDGQSQTLSDLIDKRGEYFDERLLIEEHIDFGNRDSVVMQVLDPFISASEKRDMLNSGVTTVSDDVLINYMNSNPPSNMLYQVLQYNSPLSDKVIYVMMEQADMPNGMKQQILLIQSGLSKYEASAQVLQEIQLELNAIESDIIEKYLTDTTGVYSILDVVAMYENTPIKDELYQERLFAAYVGANMSNEADSLANILKTNKNDVNYSFFMDLTVQSISMNYFDILSSDSTIFENLEMLAEGDDYYYAPRARAILSGYLGYKFDIELPEESGTKSMQIPQYTYDGSIYEPITVFPNPASDHFFIVFDEYADMSQNREARIYDLAGNLQFTRAFDDNAYVLEINSENMTKGM